MRARAGLQWPSFPPAATVAINSDAGLMLLTTTEMTSFTVLSKAPLRTFLDG